MPETLAYEFEMTPEFARAAAAPLEQVLWAQNERLYHVVEARVRFRSRLRPLGIFLCILGMALAILGWWLDPRKSVVFAEAFAIFGVLLLVFLNLESIERWMRRQTRRLIAFRARRTMAAVARRAPYWIRYELGDGVLTTQVEKMKLSRMLELKRVRAAVECADFVCVFARPLGQRPARVLYVPGPREHDALCAALAAQGAEVAKLAES